jgi:hypothetical protein
MDIEEYDSYFKQKLDVIGKMGISSTQKCMVVIKILAYGFASNIYNEYVRLGDNKAMKALEQFVKAIKELYESTYLRQLTQEDLQKKLSFDEKERDSPSMFRSLDCMHYEWKNCPNAWAGRSISKQ